MTGRVLCINGERWEVGNKASWGDYWYIHGPDGKSSVRATALLRSRFGLA